MADAYYGPRSRSNARALLDAAAALGFDSRVVRTAQNGYLVPEEIVSYLAPLKEIEEGVVYPPPQQAPPVVLERPRGNFGREKWADYARSLDIVVTDEDTRDDLIAKVDALENEKEND